MIGYVMQEPILWNQSIKANVLYGKPEATDAEVRHACELANATSFIESNFEELDKAERATKTAEQLSEKINALIGQYKAFSDLQSFATEKQPEKTKLVLEILEKSDAEVLTFIQNNMAAFTDNVQKVDEKTGTIWFDLIVNFEHQVQIQKALDKIQEGGIRFQVEQHL